jgi:hypothetical protein
MPALPAADNGRMRATLIWPVPSVVSGTGGPLGGCGVEEREER